MKKFFGAILFFSIIFLVIIISIWTSVFSGNKESTMVNAAKATATPKVTKSPVAKNTSDSVVILYFGNSQKDPQSCALVFPVLRSVSSGENKEKASIDNLLKGVNSKESDQGYYSNIPSGVKLQQITISNGIARVDFNNTLESGVNGFCRVATIRAQIMQTLLQFPDIKDVVISENGKTQGVLLP